MFWAGLQDKTPNAGKQSLNCHLQLDINSQQRGYNFLKKI